MLSHERERVSGRERWRNRGRRKRERKAGKEREIAATVNLNQTQAVRRQDGRIDKKSDIENVSGTDINGSNCEPKSNQKQLLGSMIQVKTTAQRDVNETFFAVELLKNSSTGRTRQPLLVSVLSQLIRKRNS